MSIEIFRKSIFIAKNITVLYFCINKLNSKKDETTSSIFRNDFGRGYFGFRPRSQKWTLDDCIDYALEKNIQLQQDKISLEESSVDVKTAKAALFPSLSFSTGQNVTNRPYQETSNTVSGTEIISSDSKTTYNGNYGLNAQWTLWNGNKRLNTIKQRRTSQQIAGLAVTETGELSARADCTNFHPDTLCRRVGED